MTFRYLIPAMLAVTMTAQAQAQMPPAQYEAGSRLDTVDGTTQADEIGLEEDRHERMTVPVAVAGFGPFEFLVDTGADRSAVSRQLANRLQLPKGPSARLHSVAGPSVVETANVSELRMSAQRVPDVDAALLERSHMGADGIIGVDALSSQSVLFDFKEETMSIIPSERRSTIDDKDPDTIVVTGRLRRGRLLLTRAGSSGGNVDVVVDTGSEVTVANDSFRKKLFRDGRLRNAEQVEILSVTGQKLTGQYMILPWLEIGGATLRDLPVVFAEAHTFKQLGLSEKPALLLGMNAMRAFDKVSIDFANRKLRLILPEHSGLKPALLAQASIDR